MVSDETIQQAAKVIDGILSADPQIAHEMFGDEPDKIARALDEAGLLAHATHEEWGTRFDGGYVHPGMNAAYPFWFKGGPPNGVNVHRYVTAWEEA